MECTDCLRGLFVPRSLPLFLVSVHVIYSVPLSLFMYPTLLSTRRIRVLRAILVAIEITFTSHLNLRKLEELSRALPTASASR